MKKVIIVFAAVQILIVFIVIALVNKLPQINLEFSQNDLYLKYYENTEPGFYIAFDIYDETATLITPEIQLRPGVYDISVVYESNGKGSIYADYVIGGGKYAGSINGTRYLRDFVGEHSFNLIVSRNNDPIKFHLNLVGDDKENNYLLVRSISISSSTSEIRFYIFLCLLVLFLINIAFYCFIKRKNKLSIIKALGYTFIVLLIIFRLIFAIQHDTFYIDEESRAGVVKAILTNNFPTEFDHFGLFFVKTDGDYSPITFLGPATLWATIFGYSIISLRLFVSLSTIGSIILLGRAISYWYKGNLLVWLLATIIGLLIPWNFLQGMLFWDPTFVTIYIIIAFWAFSRLANPVAWDKAFYKVSHIAAYVLLPLALVASVYTYVSISFLAVSLYILFYVYLFRNKHINVKQISIVLVLSFIYALPLVIAFFTWPAYTGRVGGIAITSIIGRRERISAFIQNMDMLLSFDYLFFTGDKNLRHATGAISGMLGIGSILPSLTLLYFCVKGKLNKSEAFLGVISISGFFLSLLPAALTVEGNPHSLRSCGTWIFIVILVSIGLIKLYQNQKHLFAKITLILSLFIIAFYTIAYLWHFNFVYLPTAHYYFLYNPEHHPVFPFVEIYTLP
ncbi:MAG: hypothetical protein FWE14_00720 [Lachnospiraceae bacterium]|nr:hypothetical protein [Lachnospiraceae bacterium]